MNVRETARLDPSEKTMPASFFKTVVPLAGREVLQFWESKSVPKLTNVSPTLKARIDTLLHDRLAEIMRAPQQDQAEVKRNQLERGLELARIAARDLPLYREKYSRAGIDVDRLTSWEDFLKLPPVTKQELMKAFPSGCVRQGSFTEHLYETRSTGSSGETLDIRIDEGALAIDAVQGVRQYSLQLDHRYGPQDTVVNICTVPWVVSEISGSYVGHFISSIIPPDDIAKILSELKPNIISVYPTVLESILQFREIWSHDALKLIVTNSEHSTAASRKNWSELIGVPILDEYSSEEATRIAIELPCGHYHICEDTVIFEVLDPKTMLPQAPGEVGIVAVTNLLNEAMPFVRYLQGDLAAMCDNSTCRVRWPVLTELQGRANDAFITRDGRTIPSGTLLDITYRIMFDCGISLGQFELVQVRDDRVILRVGKDNNRDSRYLMEMAKNLERLLEITMQHDIDLKVVELDLLPRANGAKRRSIRREIADQ
jgi:phenylacetate-CoA ligase